jgi:hypothetical protein
MSEQEKLDTLPEENKTVEVAEACEVTTVDTPQVEADNAEAVMKKYKEEKAEMEKKLKDAKASIEQLQEEIVKGQEALAVMNKKYGEVKKENEAMMMQKKKEKRMASLVECGFEDSEIEESLAAYDALDDDAFESVVAMMKKKMAKKDEMKDKEAEAAMPPALKEAIDKKKKEEESKAETEFDTAEEILEEVEETEALDLAVGGEDGEVHSTSAALVEFVYSRLGKKLNKGE